MITVVIAKKVEKGKIGVPLEGFKFNTTKEALGKFPNLLDSSQFTSCQGGTRFESWEAYKTLST